MRRVAEPDEVARVIAFLAGPDAGYVNGEELDRRRRADADAVGDVPAPAAVSAEPLPPEVDAELRDVAAAASEDELAQIAAAYERIRRLADTAAAAPLEPDAWTS